MYLGCGGNRWKPLISIMYTLKVDEFANWLQQTYTLTLYNRNIETVFYHSTKNPNNGIRPSF